MTFASRQCCLLATTMLASTCGLAATPSPGCGNTGKTLASGSYALTDQNLKRSYRVLVPSHYQSGTAYPLVVVFHGWGGDESEFLADRSVVTISDERGYIVVAPRGLGSAAPDANPNSWSFRGSTSGLAGPDEQGAAHNPQGTPGAICDSTRTRDYTYPSCRQVARNSCSWTQCQADDVAFTLALVREVESRLCVDRSRVFASGGSNGGMFAWELGQNTASAPIFRAIAPLIGLPHRGYLDPPGKAGALPVLLITGTKDTTVPPGAWENPGHTTTSDGNAYYYTGASAMMRSWGAANSCPYKGVPAASFDTRVPQLDCRSYCGGDAQGWSIGPRGMRWPKVLDCRSAIGHDYAFSWSWELILDFFDAQSR